MAKKVFEIEMKVRDYECDSQGIVNNANYLHYFEVTRHEFMESLGISFIESHEKKIDPVVVHADLHYKSSLVGSDLFTSSLTLEKKGVKIIFQQIIRRKKDSVICCKAIIEIVVLIDGKLSKGNYYDDIMMEYLKE